jgi:hypothetical protein
VSSLATGALLATSRLQRRASLVALLLAAGLVAAAALLERHSAALDAADHTLVGAVFGVAVPVLGYLIVERAADSRRLGESLDEIARHGANRRIAALGLLGVCAALSAVAAALLALLGVTVARGLSDAGLAPDLLASAWIGAAAGFAYTCWFALGSSFGRRGGGRFWALCVDWVLGSTTTVVAAPWPRGHIRNLLGRAPVLALPQWQAGVALGALALAYLGLSLWRIER